MPGQYPPSPFEAAVGNFLNSYGAVRGIQREQGEAADRRRQAKRADQMAQVQLNEAGYQEIPLPKIEAPPGQSWTQRIGRMISGGPDQPDSIVMKTHPSAAEEARANEQAFISGRDANERAFVSGRDTQNFQHQDLIEGVKAQQAAALERSRQDAENARARGHDQTTIEAAHIRADATGSSGMAAVAKARLQGSANEMRQADARMQTFEQKLASKQASLSGADQVLGSISQNIDPHQGLAASVASTMAMQHLQKSNPELAQYLRDAMTFAEGEQGVMQRPSDFRMRVSQFLSAARSGVQPNMIAPIQQRRSSFLSGLPSSSANPSPQGSGTKMTINGKTFVIPD